MRISRKIFHLFVRINFNLFFFVSLYFDYKQNTCSFDFIKRVTGARIYKENHALYIRPIEGVLGPQVTVSNSTESWNFIKTVEPTESSTDFYIEQNKYLLSLSKFTFN